MVLNLRLFKDKVVNISLVQEYLQRRLSLYDEANIPEPMLFKAMIIPVVSIDELLSTVELDPFNLNATGNGWQIAFTVPINERWLIYAVELVRGAGDGLLSDYGMGEAAATIQIASQGAAANLFTGMRSWLLDAGQHFVVKVSALTAASAWAGMVYYKKELL